MKKNMMTVLILALLIINIILTSVMMVSVMSTNKKSAKLVTDIATVLNLQLTEPGEEVKENEVTMADTATYEFPDAMTIPLSDDSYIVFNVSLSMNTKHKDYKTYGETLATNKTLIQDAVTSVFTNKSSAECRADFDNIKKEVLKQIQDLYQSDFIYNVSIINIKYGG